MVYCSNRDGRGDGRVLSPGNYGLSNELLDTPWLKVQRGKAGLEQVMQQHSSEDQLTDALMKMLADDTW